MATAEEERNLNDFRTTNTRVSDVHSHISGGQQTTWMNLLGARVLNVAVKRQLDGKDTNLGTEISWLPTNFRNVLQAIAAVGKQVAEVLELLKQIAAAQSVPVDTEALARATAQELTKLVDSVEQERVSTTVNLKELPELEDLGEIK